MTNYTDAFWSYVGSVKQDLWNWFGHLNLEEWLLVLGLAAAFGFLCMLGYGSRSKY